MVLNSVVFPALLAGRKCSGTIIPGSEHETKNQANWLPLEISSKFPVSQGKQTFPCFVVRQKKNFPLTQTRAVGSTQAKPHPFLTVGTTPVKLDPAILTPVLPLSALQKGGRAAAQKQVQHSIQLHTQRQQESLWHSPLPLPIISISSAASRFCVYLSRSHSMHC